MSLSEIPKSSQFLFGPFWPISIRKTDTMGSDLGNFYPDVGYDIFSPATFKLDTTYGIPEAHFLSFICSGLIVSLTPGFNVLSRPLASVGHPDEKKSQICEQS